MKLRLLALGVFLLSLTSCFDVFETITLKDDGSGIYEAKMDLTRSMSMIAMMKAQSGGSDSKKMPQKMDSIFYTKDMIDTVTTLSAEEKQVLSKSFAKIHIDEDEGEMYVTLTYPFANAKEFQLVQQAMSKGSTGNLFKALGGAMGQQQPAGAGSMGEDKKPSLPTSDFNYTLTGTSLVRKVKPSSNPDKPKTEDDSQMPPQLKEMMKMNYTTTVILPRPAKSMNGKNGTLSADKKQAKFSKSITFDDKLTPADFDFSLEY